MTNREKIDNMTNWEFAHFLDKITTSCFYCDCAGCPIQGIKICNSVTIEEWLESEVESDD